MTVPRIVAFLGLLFGVSALVHRYLWVRLVRDVAFTPGLHRGLTVLFILAAIALPIAIPLGRFVSRAWAGPIGWFLFTYMGLVFFALVFLGLGELGFLADRVVSGPADDERRRFFARVLGGGAAALTAGLSTWGIVNVRRGAEVKKVHVPVTRWPASRAGYTIVQLTDVHVGPLIGKDFIESIVAQVNALQPDLVAITGDLVDGTVEDLADHVAPLAKLQAKDGVYFVTGNHEYYSGVDPWLAHLATLGIRVLRNERVAIGGADGFDLAGVDDWTAHQFGGGHGMDLEKALDGRNPDRPLVLLAHQPRALDQAVAAKVDLMLSGHTHGGQMKPFHLLVRLAQPLIEGLHRVQDTFAYVSPGTGFWGPPMRLGTTCEITRVELGTTRRA